MHWKHKLCNSEGYSLCCFLVFITQINKSLGSPSLDSLLRGGRLIKSQELFLLNVEWIQYLSQKKWILRSVLATRDRVEDKTIKSVLNFNFKWTLGKKCLSFCFHFTCTCYIFTNWKGVLLHWLGLVEFKTPVASKMIL